MFRKKLKLISAAFLIIIIAFSVVIYYSMNNLNFLLMIHSGLNKPSKMYTIITKQIFKQFNTDNDSQKIIAIIEENSSAYDVSFLFYCIGIIGDKNSSQFIIDSSVKYERNHGSYSIKHYIICAMGLISDKRFIPILENYLYNYEELESFPTKGTIAQALYLITGERYNYINRWGEDSALVITDEMLAARDVIVQSSQSNRTVEEMICLDKLDYPPDGMRIRGK